MRLIYLLEDKGQIRNIFVFAHNFDHEKNADLLCNFCRHIDMITKNILWKISIPRPKVNITRGYRIIFSCMFVCKMMYMIAAMKLAIWNSLIKDGNYSIILQARLSYLYVNYLRAYKIMGS